MSFNAETIAALVFLILYSILFVILLAGYLTRRLKVKSRYGIIFFHVTIRLASQATGLAFGIVGVSATSLCIAYFTLYAPQP
jgi:cytochrome b561